MNHPLPYVFSLLLLGLGLPLAAEARCITTRYGETLCAPAESRCVNDRYRDPYCSGSGGDAVLDRYGTAVCGVGRCVMERDGAVMCSTEPRGSAALDRYAKAVCTGGCEPAQASRCKPLTK